MACRRERPAENLWSAAALPPPCTRKSPSRSPVRHAYLVQPLHLEAIRFFAQIPVESIKPYLAVIQRSAFCDEGSLFDSNFLPPLERAPLKSPCTSPTGIDYFSWDSDPWSKQIDSDSVYRCGFLTESGRLAILPP